MNPGASVVRNSTRARYKSEPPESLPGLHGEKAPIVSRLRSVPDLRRSPLLWRNPVAWHVPPKRTDALGPPDDCELRRLRLPHVHVSGYYAPLSERRISHSSLRHSTDMDTYLALCRVLDYAEWQRWSCLRGCGRGAWTRPQFDLLGIILRVSCEPKRKKRYIIVGLAEEIKEGHCTAFRGPSQFRKAVDIALTREAELTQGRDQVEALQVFKLLKERIPLGGIV